MGRQRGPQDQVVRPETEGVNVVVDQASAVQYLLEIKEHVASGTLWTTTDGLLGDFRSSGR